MACSSCAQRTARKAAQAGNAPANSGKWMLRLPDGSVETYSTQTEARAANQRNHKGRGLVRPA